MNTNVHQDFKGYGAYPLSESERMVRERLMGCMDFLREKNETCLVKARDEGREKLMSEILSVKSLMRRIIEEMEKSMKDARYRFDRIPAPDETAVMEIDTRLEKLLAECGGIMEALTCSETDMHIIDHFTHVVGNLNEIAKLFHERVKIFKKMQIYG